MNVSFINSFLLKLEKRAESSAGEKLVESFVDVGPLFTMLSTRDHQVLFGRRGTGKTHAFKYLEGTRRSRGDVALFIDLRSIGSTGGLYSDQGVGESTRATGLIVDVLCALHQALLAYCVQNAAFVNLAELGPSLDRLADAITDVTVVGTAEITEEASTDASLNRAREFDASVGPTGVGAGFGFGATNTLGSASSTKTVRRGNVLPHINYGSASVALREVVDRLSPRTIWVLIDEWSSLPIELQPYLADALRRIALPISGLVLKIAAIEHRARFAMGHGGSSYFGIEIGADLSAGVDLDDFMVFDNDETLAKSFFTGLVHRHALAIAREEGEQSAFPDSEAEFVRLAFTEKRAVEEFVRSAEGVPRDAINIIVLAAQYALDKQISVENVRTAARNWYQRDKARAVSGIAEAGKLLNWIMSEVIGSRKARAFLLSETSTDPLILALNDARVLHVLRRSISSPASPGERYRVYKLDYGCYVDLLSTSGAPHGLLPAETADGADGHSDVPPDDYRSIRRAILDLSRFYARPN